MVTQSSFPQQAILVFAVLSLYLCILLAKSLLKQGQHDVPVVGKNASFVLPVWRARIRHISHGVEMIKNGYLKVPFYHYADTIFQIPTVDQNLLVLPTKYVDELKSLPETTMSSSQAIADIVGRTSARIFVGHPLCRDPVWLKTSIHFARCVFLRSGILKVIPRIIRPVAALFLPHMVRIRRHHRNARKILIPEVLHRRQQASGVSVREVMKPNDMLQWFEDASEGADARPERIVERQLGMSFAAIHSTTNHLTNVIYDLAARWQDYGPALRAEVEEVLAETNGTWEKTTLTKLSKMDSFMKESQRMNPPSALSFHRKLQTSYTILSSSPARVLPKDSYIAGLKYHRKIGMMVHWAISASESIYESPATFDGFRFHRMRMAPGGSAQSHQFVTTGLESMTFGHGRFACPGRFFASYESKIVLALLLLKYDIKFEKGSGGGRSDEKVAPTRPRNLVFADACYPDPDVQVMFKRRIG
ncbi:MAG: hypothetical protein Q9208_006302 [Pyrenodesmia sp. 3 TL-2023]